MLYFACRMTRPRMEFDWKQIQRWFTIQCPVEDVCFLLNCHPKTLDKACRREQGMTIYALRNKYSALGRAEIREQMHRLVELGSAGGKNTVNVLKYLDEKYMGGLPALPQGPVGTTVTINNNSAVITAGSMPAALPPASPEQTIDLLRQILGKNKEPEPALPAFVGSQEVIDA